MGLGVDIRIDADGDMGGPPGGLGGGAQDIELGQAFHVNAHNTGAERVFQFGAGLADAGEHHRLGRDAGGERAFHLASRDHVGTGAEARQRRQHGNVGVRLDREADARIEPRDGIGEGLVMALQGRGGIAIERRADGFGNGGDRHALGMELTVLVIEMVHGEGPGSKMLEL